MYCKHDENCGGCLYRDLSIPDYRKLKIRNFEKTLCVLGKNFVYNNPIFIDDTTRRRAALSFCYQKKQLSIGFNQKSTNNLINIEDCPLLTPALNAILPEIRLLVAAVCAIPYRIKKGKKTITQTINSGNVWLCEAENGIDVVLEYDAPLELEHRMELFEQVQSIPQIIRLSHRRKTTDSAEPIIEKSKPFIKIGNYEVYIPAATFLQPSQQGEKALTSIVSSYLSCTNGKIADLFCGVGTFSYILAQNIKNKIIAVDSSAELLKGFKDSLNRNQIPNIEIINKNLFKYPLDNTELKDFDAIVLDPPRAGASAQIKQITKLGLDNRLKQIIMVSCNPHSFVNDAASLIEAGYSLKEVTMIDQFVYSNHNELVALFTK